jgi:hypothetical protein
VTAANDLGLTDAVPDRITVLTDGRLRPIRLGNLTIDFQYKAPRRVLPPPKTRTYHKGKEVSDNR